VGFYGDSNALSYSAESMGFLKNCPLSGNTHMSGKDYTELYREHKVIFFRDFFQSISLC
jgi:hypothetical protein